MRSIVHVYSICIIIESVEKCVKLKLKGRGIGNIIKVSFESEGRQMADMVYKIIACEPDFEITQVMLEDAVKYLRGCVRADSIEARYHGKVTFVDCGGNLESITCPCCKAELAFDWWGEAMEQSAKKSFEDLYVMVPCCGREINLNELEYDFPCGFGRWVIEVLNPQGEFTAEIMQELEKMSGGEVKVILGRY